MVGLERPRAGARLALGIALAAAASGCGSTRSSAISWRVDFECAADGQKADTVRIGISDSDCSGAFNPIYESEVVRDGDTVETGPRHLPSGIYAFHANALDPRGKDVASACVMVMLPSSETVELSLRGEDGCRGAGGEPTTLDADAGLDPDECATEPFDTKGYRDAQDYSCKDWSNDDCTEAEERWGYTAAEQESILANCSKSCSVCPP